MEQLDKDNHLSMALRLCGVRVDKKELELILHLFELTREKGADTDLKSICKVEAEVNELMKK